MFIRKKPPRPHALGEPILHPDHKRPVTRRELISAGLLSAPAVMLAPAWLGSLLRTGTAGAATLSTDIQQLQLVNECNISNGPNGVVPFICFDLAGGANLVGSEVIVGVQGGQSNFLSTAGYGKLGVPGNMVPTSSTFISSALGLLWHSDGAILRGILTKATTPATAANTNGAVICAMSQNDTGNNPHNPMYGIAKVAQQLKQQGQILNLIGNVSSVSGGNSAAPPTMVDPAQQPTKIAQTSDVTSLVSTGGAVADPVSVAVMEAQARISGGTSLTGTTPTSSEFSGALSSVQLMTDTTADANLKKQLRCNYVKSVSTANEFADPGALDATKDTNITGGATPIFTAADFNDSDVQKTASVMKMVLNGYALAGTITLGGYDYHDGTRATGEMRNFKAGQMIGAVLEYAQRLGKRVMIYVFSDGSLTSSAMVDNSTNGRGKLAWQADNQSTASTFMLVYNPGGRPQLTNGAASQQIGYFSSDGSVVSTSSPAANSVMQIVETVLLNYVGLHTSLAGQFSSIFPSQGLGAATAQAALTAFAPII